MTPERMTPERKKEIRYESPHGSSDLLYLYITELLIELDKVEEVAAFHRRQHKRCQRRLREFLIKDDHL